MEDFDVRISNLSARLAVDQDDPNNSEYVSYLPSNISTDSPEHSGGIGQRSSTHSPISSSSSSTTISSASTNHSKSKVSSSNINANHQSAKTLPKLPNNPKHDLPSTSKTTLQKNTHSSHSVTKKTASVERSSISPNTSSPSSASKSGNTSFSKFFKSSAPMSSSNKSTKQSPSLLPQSNDPSSNSPTARQPLRAASRESKVLLASKHKPHLTSSSRSIGASPTKPPTLSKSSITSSKSQTDISCTQPLNNSRSQSSSSTKRIKTEDKLRQTARTALPSSKTTQSPVQSSRSSPSTTKRTSFNNANSNRPIIRVSGDHTDGKDVTSLYNNNDSEYETDKDAKGMRSPLTLPAMLSPTLPGWCDDIEIFKNDKKASNSPLNISKSGNSSFTKGSGDAADYDYNARYTSSTSISDENDENDENAIRPRRNSLIVSLKVPINKSFDDRQSLSEKTSLNNTTTSIKKRTASSSQPEADLKKKRRVSRDYSDSDSDGEAPSRKKLRNKASAISKSKRSDDSFAVESPKPDNGELPTRQDSPLSVTRVPAPSVGAAGSPETTFNLPSSISTAAASNSLSSNNSSTIATPLTTNVSRPTLTEEQRNSAYQTLMNKANLWKNRAREKKHRADQYHKKQEVQQAAVYAFDSLLGYIVAFDYQDKADLYKRKVRQNQDWLTLVPFIGWIVSALEESDARTMIGMCYQVRALIHLRVGQCYLDLIKKILAATSPGSKNSDSSNASTHYRDLATLTSKYMKEQNEATQAFKRGMRDLSIETIRLQFPDTWKARDNNIVPPEQQSRGFRPMEDSFYLPLHMFSSIQEAAALGFRIVTEWSKLNNIKYESVLAQSN